MIISYDDFIKEAKEEEITRLIFPDTYKDALGKEAFLGWEELMDNEFLRLGFKTGNLLSEIFPGPDSWREEPPHTPKELISEVRTRGCSSKEEEGLFYFGFSLSMLFGSIVAATIFALRGGERPDPTSYS